MTNARWLSRAFPWILSLALFIVAVSDRVQMLRLNAAESDTPQATMNEFANPCVTPSWGKPTGPDLVRLPGSAYLVWRCENTHTFVIRLEPESVR